MVSTRPLGLGRADVILPDTVVPGMDAAFETGVPGCAHEVGAGLADVRRRQQGAVHQGLEAVVFHHRGARDLAEEARTEDLLQRPAGVVGAERKQEGGTGAMAAQLVDQVGDAHAGAAVGIGVDLESEFGQFAGPERG